jgi:hypothetical protein
MKRLLQLIYLHTIVLGIRYQWYKFRKAKGYPITLRRAMFSQMPRFGAFEEHEAGCPEWDKRDYDAVK